MGSLSGSNREELETALHLAHLKYVEIHPLSKKTHDEASRFLPGGNTRTVLYNDPFPLTIASGQSCYLTTVDEHTYVDFLGEYTAGIYGHNHPVIKAAVEQALRAGWNYGAHGIMEHKLARTICERFPAMEMVRFVNSGTEANMMALATALVVTRKKKVLIFNKGYHGSTISGRIRSTSPSINLPHEFVLGQYNDVEGTRKIVESLPHGSLAAILVEPMLGSGGCFAGSYDFLNTLQELAIQCEALLIFDEVMTSRLAYGGLGNHMNITPDLMTIGKWIGGGMSFGAFGGRRDIMSLYDPKTGQLEHPGTFNNNVFSMTAGVAGCKLLDTEALDKLNQMGTDLQMSLKKVFMTHDIVGEVPQSPLSPEVQAPENAKQPPKMFVTGMGSLIHIHFSGSDRELLQALFFHHMLAKGIYLASRGFVSLSIEITEQHTNLFITAVGEFCCRWQTVLMH